MVCTSFLAPPSSGPGDPHRAVGPAVLGGARTVGGDGSEHDGKPATVRDTTVGGEPGVLRTDFPGGAGSDVLEETSWDDSFANFDEDKLAFLYHEHKASGEDSTFFKLVSR